jgi:hypothetical protein
MAQEQAERSTTPVKAAALLRIARVWTALDQEAASVALERGISSTLELLEPDRSILLQEAVSLAATVSPQRALQLAASIRPATSAVTDRMIYNMLHHGHAAEAIDYLSRGDFGDHYPFVAASEAMACSSDEESERTILRAAIRGWLQSSRQEPGESTFLCSFELRWKILPQPEALQFVREAVKLIVSDQDRQTRATFGGVGDAETVSFSSTRECRLFKLVGPLRQLAPELADSLHGQYPEFAVASAQYPHGYHHPSQAPELPEAEEEDLHEFGHPMDYITVGDTWIQVSEDLDRTFEQAFEAAHRLYQEDSAAANPNTAPQECWPSVNAFRNILYRAGRYEGSGAARRLSRVPEGSLRLFAQIEMLAALGSLPPIGYTSIGPRRGSPGSCAIGPTCPPAELDEIFGPEQSGIRCPKCMWTPRTKSLWTCKCGHCWNTFDTHGLCPGCGYQWEITGCFRCGAMSPHPDWYLPCPNDAGSCI